MRLLFCLFVLLASATATFQHRYFEDVLLENMPERSKIYTGNPQTSYFEQKIDHFDSNNLRTFYQQYFTDASNWRGPGDPVFLYMGGEADLTENAFYFSWCAEYAPQFNALCLALEHRFYGDSFPISNPNPEDLKLLSASQALADASNFITAMTYRFELPEDTKWITFGGSYPGTLAAWMRLKHPDQVYGAISTSGPLLAKADFREYLGVVREALEDQSPECMPAIEQASQTLKNWQMDPSSHHLLCEWFGYCDNYSDDYFSNFYAGVTFAFMGAAQYNNFESDSPFSNVKLVCDIMTDALLGEPVFRLREFLYWNNQKTSDEQNWWINQVCDEFGWLQTSHEFGNDFVTVEWMEKAYCSQFGPEFTPAYIDAQIAQTNALFGGKNLEVTNVVFVHGTIDPWSAMGRTEPWPNNDNDVLIIKDGSHCQNMYPNIENNWPNPTMALAKSTIRARLEQWVL